MTDPGAGAALPALPLASPDVTRAFGVRLAALLRAGDVVLLDGPLGAGKTVLVQGLAQGLDVQGSAPSPTFVLVREHRPRRPDGLHLLHLDAYRLRGDGDVGTAVEALGDLDLDLDGAVAAVEWGLGLGHVLAGSWLELRLERPRTDPVEDGTRLLRAAGVGPRWEAPQARDALEGLIAGGDTTAGPGRN